MKSFKQYTKEPKKKSEENIKKTKKGVLIHINPHSSKISYTKYHK